MMALSKGKTLDHEIQQQIDTARQIWRSVLVRLVDATFIAKKLPFRGHQEDGISTNKGNLVELVELLNKFDPVPRKHYSKEYKDNRYYSSPDSKRIQWFVGQICEGRYVEPNSQRQLLYYHLR